MDYLASVTDLKVFGCSIDFLQTATQTYLEDPIWDKLQQGMAHTLVFRNCNVILPSQEQLEGCPISVESGIRLIGAEAWQNCRQLRIVKLPATVIGISDNVFRDRKLLSSVLAPGCQSLCGMLFLAMGVCIGRGCK